MRKWLSIFIVVFLLVAPLSFLSASALTVRNDYISVEVGQVSSDTYGVLTFENVYSENIGGSAIEVVYQYVNQASAAGTVCFKYVINVLSGKGCDLSFTLRFSQPRISYLVSDSKIYSESAYGTVSEIGDDDNGLQFEISSDSPVIYVEACLYSPVESQSVYVTFFDNFTITEKTTLDNVIDEDYDYEEPSTDETKNGIALGIEILDDLTSKLDDFSAALDENTTVVITKLDGFKQLVHNIFNLLPDIVVYLLYFVLSFLVIRKVVGR